MAITPENEGTIDPPIAKTSEAAGSVAIPIAKTSEAQPAISIPNNPTAEAVGAIIAPIAKNSNLTTNLLTYSEQFDHADWTKTRSSVTDNVAANPNGDLLADSLIEDSSSSNTHFVEQAGISYIAGNTYTMSVYAKANQRTEIRLLFGSLAFPASPNTIFDIDGGVIVSQGSGVDSAKIENIGDGWFRCSITGTSDATNIHTALIQLSVSGSSTYSGDGVSGVYIWGAQVEESAFSTSYIKTEALPVTKGEVLIPIAKTSVAAGSVAIPIAKTSVAAGSVAIPNVIGSVAAAALPRTLIPLVKLDFEDQLYNQNGQPRTFAELFTYSRNSNASFINRRIVNNKYEYFLDTDFVGSATNLIRYSEQLEVNFDVTAVWSISSTGRDLTTEKSPTGGGNVILFRPTAALFDDSHLRQVYNTSGSNAFTASCHFKMPVGGYNQAKLRINNFGGSSTDMTVSLLDGSIISTNAGTFTGNKYSVQYVGNGWYRLTLTATTVSTAEVQIRVLCDDSVETVPDDVRGVLVWGAQLLQESFNTPYIRTISATVSKTFTENLRMTYDPVTGQKLGALIEGASTNLILRSEEFGNASWITTSVTVDSDADKAPDGTISADKIEASSTASLAPSVRQSNATTDALQYTTSVYVKRSESSFVQIRYTSGQVANNPRVNFDLSGGTIGTQDADIDDASINDMGDGWFRISATVTVIGTTLTSAFNVIQSSTDTRQQANSWTIGDGVYIWGAQCEELSFATSYIMTEGSAVTRASDFLRIPMAGNSPSARSNFTRFAKFRNSVSNVFGLSYIVNFGASVNNSFMGVNASTLRSRHGNEVFNSGVINQSADHKGANTYLSSTNIVKAFIDGVEIPHGVANTVDWIPDLSGDMSIGSIGNAASSHGFLTIKELTIYDEALTAQEVALL